MRDISISTCFDYSQPIEEQLPMIRRAEFSHVSIGGDYMHSGILQRERLLKLRESVAKAGLKTDTVHGYALNKSDTLEINEKLVEAAATLGAPVIVLHCSPFTFNPATLEERKNDILRKIPVLERLAEEYHIKFVFENVLPGVATDLAKYAISQTSTGYFGLCYDSSHDQIDGPRPFTLLEDLPSRLMAVHLSDRIKYLVDHVTPGEGFIDFTALCGLLARAGMHFPLLMDVMTHSRYKDRAEFLTVTYQKAADLYDSIWMTAKKAQG